MAIDGFTAVRTSTLARGKPLTFDIFVTVDGRPVRFAAKDTELDFERYGRLKSFKVTKVLIHDGDEDTYREYLDRIFEEAEADDKMEMSNRSQIVGSRAEVAAQEFKNDPGSRDAFIISQDVFDKLGKFLSAYESSSLEILKLSGSRQDDYEFHGLQVGTLAHLVAQKRDLIKNRDQITHMITASFFHDMSLEKIGIKLNDEGGRVEKKADFHQHPDLSCKYFEDKSYVDPLVIKIIAQHEETMNKSGFPRKMGVKEIDPLALVVSLCNRFDHYSMKFKGDIALASREFTKDQVGRYDLSYIQTIQEIFKSVAATTAKPATP